jgi:hypothetical protein
LDFEDANPVFERAHLVAEVEADVGFLQERVDLLLFIGRRWIKVGLGL